MRHEDDPSRWPLLILAGGRCVLYYEGGASVFRSAVSYPHNQLIKRLEDCELDFASGRNSDLASLVWSAPSSAESFLDLCIRHARISGGLKLHGFSGESIPFEFLESPSGMNPAEIVYTTVTEKPIPGYEDNSRGEKASQIQKNLRILIYFNPSGIPLPQAASMAARLSESMSSGTSSEALSFHYSARALSRNEYSELFEKSDIVFYFGHGKCIGGLPAIPSDEGWAGFFPDINLKLFRNKVVFFCGCMDGELALSSLPDCCFIYPVCRIADRADDFIWNIWSYWTRDINLYGAFRRAIARDAESADIRRKIYRIHGHADMALRPLRIFGLTE